MTKARAQQYLTFKALKYWCINHRNQWGFFQFEIIINVLVRSSASFEYICYGSAAIINILFILVRGTFLYVSI